MNFPSDQLRRLTKALEVLGVDLDQARTKYLRLEAQRKFKEALLTKEASGRSHAERTMNAQSSPEWLSFQMELADSKAGYESKKLQFSILEKEWLAEYQERKSDDSLIKKGAGHGG